MSGGSFFAVTVVESSWPLFTNLVFQVCFQFAFVYSFFSFVCFFLTFRDATPSYTVSVFPPSVAAYVLLRLISYFLFPIVRPTGSRPNYSLRNRGAATR